MSKERKHEQGRPSYWFGGDGHLYSSDAGKLTLGDYALHFMGRDLAIKVYGVDWLKARGATQL